MTGHSRRWLIAAAAALTAALIAVGCGPKESNNVGKGLDTDQTFVINMGEEPNSLDPSMISDSDSLNVANQLFAGLYRVLGQDNELTPYLASELPKVSEDGLTYTVKLREDAKWSNGDPITANDVVYGVRRALAPETGAYFASFMYGIIGACEYNTSGELGEGEKPGDDEASCEGFKTDRKPESIGVKAVDDYTVEFKLETQVPWFDQLLSVNTFYPLPEKAIEKGKDKWTDPANIVTSGPFTLKSWKHRKQIVLEKSKTFWAADDVELETVNVEMVADPKTAIKQFEKGKLDTGFTRRMVPSALIEKWKKDDRYVSVMTTSTAYVYLNTTNETLKDPKVRQGISLAIDRKSLVDNVTKRGDIPLGTVIPTTMPGFDTIKEGTQDFIDPEAAPDVDKAKELMKEGGWKDGTELSLYFASEGSSTAMVAEQIQSDLAKVGVKAKLVPVAADTLYGPGVGTSPIGPKVDMVMLGWIMDYLDAQDYYQLWTCDNVEAGLNASNFCDEEYDKVYAEALKTVDFDARVELYKQLEAMLTGPDGAMPVVPIYQPTDDTVVQPWVEGFEITPSGLLFFDTVSILEH